LLSTEIFTGLAFVIYGVSVVVGVYKHVEQEIILPSILIVSFY